MDLPPSPHTLMLEKVERRSFDRSVGFVYQFVLIYKYIDANLRQGESSTGNRTMSLGLWNQRDGRGDEKREHKTRKKTEKIIRCVVRIGLSW